MSANTKINIPVSNDEFNSLRLFFDYSKEALKHQTNLIVLDISEDIAFSIHPQCLNMNDFKLHRTCIIKVPDQMYRKLCTIFKNNDTDEIPEEVIVSKCKGGHKCIYRLEAYEFLIFENEQPTILRTHIL